MSVHGYPALTGRQVNFYCNLKLGFLKLQEETAGTSHAVIDQYDVSVGGVLQGAVGGTVCYCFIPVSACRCWAIIRGFPIRQRPVCAVDAVFAPVQIGFWAQCWSCFSGSQG